MSQNLAALRRAVAEQESKTATTKQVPGKTPGNQWTKESVYVLGTGTLLYGLITLGLMTFLLYKKKSAEAILRTFGVTLIITAAVFLVVAGYSESQISPVMGLLGAIAGYLLGKGEKPHPPDLPATAAPAGGEELR